MSQHAELRDLYQQVIMDHNKSPRHFHEMTDADHIGHGNNPLCGDTIIVYLKVRHEVIEEVSFQGSGCAISMASASLMTEALKGKNVKEAVELYRAVHAELTGESENQTTQDLGKLSVLSGVREFPARVKCATLAWHTVESILTDPNDTDVTTE